MSARHTQLRHAYFRRANLLLGVGFCGAFTTFSTFSVDTLTMLQRGQNSRAAAYVLCSNLLSIGAAAAGHRLTLPPPILRALRPPGG
jgi:protein CrcB|mmetsp:Transcript_18696/g.54019  ORF Transcript_18696/g.54019 Transcript_18696/m.54019 type:complete len:87 (+) Transcript_18696:279-539(+)